MTLWGTRRGTRCGTRCVPRCVKHWLLSIVLLPACVWAELLPEVPSPGLRITVSVSCDFTERWWEATLYPGSDLPLEFKAGPREAQRRLDPSTRADLYARAIEAFAEFRVDRAPRFIGPGADRRWTGERTITLSAMTLDDELGRVDRVAFDIDVMRGRALPAATLELVDALSNFTRLAELEINCD